MREDLLNGRLEYPGLMSIIKFIEKEDMIYSFWNAIWVSFLNNEDVNGLYWYKQLEPKCFNYIVRALAANGWVTSNSFTGRKWASVALNEEKLLEFVTPDELQTIKTHYKYSKYTLTRERSTATDKVRQNKITRKTGLVRKGFCAAGNSEFMLDTRKLEEYAVPIKRNLTKSMEKIRGRYKDMRSDSASYDKVITGLFDWHCDNPKEVFTTGNSIIDSRGRAVSSCQKKATNPITNKDFRACLVIPTAGK